MNIVSVIEKVIKISTVSYQHQISAQKAAQTKTWTLLSAMYREPP